MSFHCFGLAAEQVTELLAQTLKPDDISSTDPEKQHERVHELVHWFARASIGRANPKWFQQHAYELAYYVATTSPSHRVDLSKATLSAYRQGLDDAERHAEIVAKLAPAEATFIPAEVTDEFLVDEWGKACRLMETEGKRFCDTLRAFFENILAATVPPTLVMREPTAEDVENLRKAMAAFGSRPRITLIPDNGHR